MTPAPAVSPVALRLYEGMSAYSALDEQNGWALLLLCEARARTLAKSTDALRYDDIGSGKRRMRSATRCPAWALPSLAQYAGVDLPPGVTDDQARSMIRDAPGLRRGTPDAMVAAIKLTLTGMRTVRLLERDTSAYHFTVITRTAETPDPAATVAAIRSQKPVGLRFDHLITDDPLIAEGTRLIADGTASIGTATIGDIT